MIFSWGHVLVIFNFQALISIKYLIFFTFLVSLAFLAFKFKNSTTQLSLDSRSNLNKHVKRHELAEQKKKTECEFCELKFSSIGALNLHIRKMHYKSVPEDFRKTEIKQERWFSVGIWKYKPGYESHDLCSHWWNFFFS